MSNVATSCTIAAYTGWPYGSDPFYVVISPGTAAEEKVLVTRTGATDTTLNVESGGRGADDTSAQSHDSGAAIYPVFAAKDADEANMVASTQTTKGDLLAHTGTAHDRLAVGSDGQALVADSGETTGLAWASVISESVVDAKGDLLAGTAADTVSNLAVGSNGQVLVADSGETTGLKWTDVGDFTTFTPTFTNLTIGNATVDFAYSIIGKMMVVNGRISFGSTTSITGTLGMTLPASATSARYCAGTIYIRNSGIASYGGFVTAGPASTNLSFQTPTVSGSSVVYEVVDATTPFTLGGGDFILLSILVEIQ
jgi:hypothetical protein